MELGIKLDKLKKYIIGVSGGPDSMTLLFLLNTQGYTFKVCFVNYHTREESNLEEQMVRDYCFEKGIEVAVLSTYFKGKGNFESWARNERYNFFKNEYEKYGADGLLIAHHQDDLIETYIMQKKRKSIVKYYGLNEKTELMGMNVYRPLLHVGKKEIMVFCKDNNIPFSIDKTNLECIHTRNKIRHEIVEKMSFEDRNKIVVEINELNKENEIILNKINYLLKSDKYYCKLLSGLNNKEKQMFIYFFITNKVPELFNKLSWTRIYEISKCLESSKANLIIPISKKYVIEKKYEFFEVKEVGETIQYSYVLEKPSAIDTKYFSCDFKCDTSYLKITQDSYPLTIRNARTNDLVTIGNLTKKINRIFIDEKIPLDRRTYYPVVCDKTGKIVYIPLYKSYVQKNIADKLKFVIK